MKVLIWIGCFVVATILNTLLGYATGVKVGYLIFYFGVYFVARNLCNKWDDYREFKIIEKSLSDTKPQSVVDYNQYFQRSAGRSTDMTPVPATGWRCSCGRPHPRYETSCVCGKSKLDNINCPKTEEMPAQIAEFHLTADKILFCRKCGKKLLDDSRFCSKCGIEVLKE